MVDRAVHARSVHYRLLQSVERHKELGQGNQDIPRIRDILSTKHWLPFKCYLPDGTLSLTKISIRIIILIIIS